MAGNSAIATASRWSRAFVATGVGFFLAWQAAVALGFPRAATVPLGVAGFVLHVAFGKAYALVPSYFARELAVPSAPAVHLPFALVGAAGAGVAGAGIGPAILASVAATAWFVGCLVFVATLCWTVRGNPTGHETGTGASDGHRERTDRLANAAVPAVLAYLLVGSALPLAGELGLEFPIAATGPSATHLLAAGTAALLVFAVGFRLLPRLLVASVRRGPVAAVLLAGAVGPALLAVDGGRRLSVLGAALYAAVLWTIFLERGR